MTTTEEMSLPPHIDWEKSTWKVERLREKLGTKAKQEKNFKFYSLYGHICNMHVLTVAWKKVRENDGSPGIDGVTIDSLDTEDKVMKFLTEIQTELQNRTYKPLPVKRVYIPKSNGGLRPLGIPCLRDRVIQTAACLILEPIFEADFLDCSYGFRPGRSQHQALFVIRDALKAGMTSAYDADMKAYFDTIPHDKLMLCIKMRVVDGNVINLIRMWLRAEVHEKNDKSNGYKISHPKTGTPQGGVISPLLSNIYLHWFDKEFHKTRSARTNKAKLIRFADDFIILAKEIEANCCQFVEDKIEKWLGLTINKDKTKIVNLEQGDELNFLGYVFQKHKDLKGRGHKYLHMGPSKKAINKEMERLRELTNKEYCYLPIPKLIKKINEQLNGWKAYFSRGYPRMAFRKINNYARKCVINHLRKRSQRHYRPPKGVSYYKHIYNQLGLIYL
jgi:RNA-directed DNA polymerase